MVTILSIQTTEADDVEEPVTIEEAMKWARIDSDDDKELIYTMMVAARQDVELETNLKLVENEVVMSVCGSGRVGFHYGTSSDVVIKAIDEEGTEATQTVGEDFYNIGSEVNLYESGDYKITYTVGTTVTQGLKEAILMLVAYRYNNRADQEKQHGMPDDIQRKLSNYKAVYI